MKKIKQLTKTELLSIIYNHMPATIYDEHPVDCASCGTGPDKIGKVQLIFYICDNCENNLV